MPYLIARKQIWVASYSSWTQDILQNVAQITSWCSPGGLFQGIRIHFFVPTADNVHPPLFSVPMKAWYDLWTAICGLIVQGDGPLYNCGATSVLQLFRDIHVHMSKECRIAWRRVFAMMRVGDQTGFPVRMDGDM